MMISLFDRVEKLVVKGENVKSAKCVDSTQPMQYAIGCIESG